MLILSRKPGQSILLSDNISLTVLSIKGKQVRIGINAPLEVSIHREEVFQKVQQAQQQNDCEALKLSGS